MACEICGTRASASFIPSLNDVDEELDSSVGSVFFPLKRCTTGAKRKSSEDQGRADNDFLDSGGFRGMKSASKAVIVEDESPAGADLRTLKTSESTVDLTDDFLDSGGFRGIKSRNKAVVISDEVCPATDIGKLKILSYNVWFREDLELHKRMEALGDLIQLHSPDLICFQEVTPNIYNIFEKSRWWNVYECSVSSKKAFTRPYFCMQLSKMPVKSFSCKPFSNSVMGRELCVTEVQVQDQMPLVVATSHLESPCPGPPKWDQMYSKERVAQAKEAVNFLKTNPNVIFCGDMNWDDKLDGQFPFPDGWTDAWAQLRPGDSGLTYDTKSNEMLSGNRTLQKRLDRFICSLRDFKINGIVMIGKEAIPGLSYCKEKKTKKEVKNLILPVLPSDHYGLLLTICVQQH
ncbi:hypothetical protein RJ639_046066 [Escallonia herrerae]|uniref:Endonuclease/exonuclease/phosphatase domain-containing protein n=1 Tax=Escallonia herrerae TaxID=1293975 RepID=A0AA89AZR9_9ASTE|nr:hypothetical protein RJ639_046066 [Escallonia herrerae]